MQSPTLKQQPGEQQFPRLARDFYYKGWRGESSIEQAEKEDQFQAALHAYGAGQDLREVLQQLLESGGDERSVTIPKTGLTKYHTPTKPCQGIFRSSCTSNVATEDAFCRGVDTLRQLLLEARNMAKQKGRDLIYSSPEDLFRKLLCDIRERLRTTWELSFEDTISLFPSGTDAELMPALLGFTRANSQTTRGTATFTVITAAGEVGSGTTLAAQGKHFAKTLPSGGSTQGRDSSVFGVDPSEITGVDLYVRDATGRLLSEEEGDHMVEQTVNEAVQATREDGQSKYGCIIIHMVVGSKTGQCMPSEACVDKLVQTYGSLVLPVVDACQGRLGEGSIRQYLDKDLIVLCTGSKFYGGPPFSGVCLMSEKSANELETMLANPRVEQMLLKSSVQEYITAPLMSDDLPKLRSLLPQRPLNYGVLMRWTLALHGMEAYYADVPEVQRIKLLGDWTAAVRNLIKERDSPLMRLLPDVNRESEHPAEQAANEQTTALSTIVSFHCRCNRGTPETAASPLSMDELRHVQLLMASDLSKEYTHLSLLGPAKTRCFIGQPVDLSPAVKKKDNDNKDHNVLRIAASAPLLVRAWQEGLDAIVNEDRALLEKLTLILGNWFIFQRQDSTRQ